MLGSCGPGVGRSFSPSYSCIFIFFHVRVDVSRKCVCAFMLSGLVCWVCSSVVFLALWCADGVFFFPFSPCCFCLPLLSPHPVHQTLPAYLMLGCWYFGLAPPQLSPSTLPPFSTPPAPSPANGPPSPKFGRDPLSYCLKEINKTVKPRISSFRTLRRSVSHQRKRFGWQETSSHQGLHIILSLLQKDVLNSSDK